MKEGTINPKSPIVFNDQINKSDLELVNSAFCPSNEFINPKLQRNKHKRPTFESWQNKAYLHEGEEEPTGSVTDRLLGVPKTLDNGGNKGIEVELEMVAGEDSCGGKRLKGALGNAEVVVFEQIHAAVDECCHLCRRQTLTRILQKLIEPLHSCHPLLCVFRSRHLQSLLHCDWIPIRSGLDWSVPKSGSRVRIPDLRRPALRSRERELIEVRAENLREMEGGSERGEKRVKRKW